MTSIPEGPEFLLLFVINGPSFIAHNHGMLRGEPNIGGTHSAVMLSISTAHTGVTA
jgi:hypothetical protein